MSFNDSFESFSKESRAWVISREKNKDEPSKAKFDHWFLIKLNKQKQKEIEAEILSDLIAQTSTETNKFKRFIAKLVNPIRKFVLKNSKSFKTDVKQKMSEFNKSIKEEKEFCQLLFDFVKQKTNDISLKNDEEKKLVAREISKFWGVLCSRREGNSLPKVLPSGQYQEIVKEISTVNFLDIHALLTAEKNKTAPLQEHVNAGNLLAELIAKYSPKKISKETEETGTETVISPNVSTITDTSSLNSIQNFSSSSSSSVGSPLSRSESNTSLSSLTSENEGSSSASVLNRLQDIPPSPGKSFEPQLRTSNSAKTNTQLSTSILGALGRFFLMKLPRKQTKNIAVANETLAKEQPPSPNKLVNIVHSF